MKKGVLLESFKKPFKESLAIAAKLRLDGVQIFAKGALSMTEYPKMKLAKSKN